MEPRLVAIDRPGGPEYVDDLLRIWDAGDAAFPVDQRLPPRMKPELVDRMSASVVVTATERRRVAGGRPVEEGDAAVVATSGGTVEVAEAKDGGGMIVVTAPPYQMPGIDIASH